jgi:molecular chaperone DnaK (HSP70)
VTGIKTDVAAVIGIDLGTTNSALSWTERLETPRTFDIPQLAGLNEIERRPVLPSFVYVPTEAERTSGGLALPWDTTGDRHGLVVGELARDHGALTPARQIASAKSWLANPSVDRTAAVLPWGVDAEVRLSPVDASARILRHLRDAWNFERARSDPERCLERQSIVLTVPASFDEEARELTVQAAHAAGLTTLRLLEEPLAALYAWIAAHRRSVADHLRDGETVLVCDVGGGTTDFTLIRVLADGAELKFERIAVGEHLLLGGDNLDLALAAQVEQHFIDSGAPRLTLTQRQSLRRKCTVAKERLLAGDAGDSVRISLAGSGRGVIGGSMSADLSRDDVVRALTEGFLPLSPAGDLPTQDRRTGLRELGLPYESDPAITRHLAAFLARAFRADDGSPAQPEVVLFNGGFFAAALARERVLEALERWHGRRPRVLVNARPETAVATGAAFYGRLLRRPDRANLLIRAGSARTYYVGLAADARSAAGTPATRAVCVMPRGTQEGTVFALEHVFTVAVNTPLAFTLYSSTERTDALNAIVEFAVANDIGDIHVHAPLVTSFRYGKRSRRVELGVRLEVAFTETGTLELWCSSTTSDHRWKLAFQLRGVEEPVDVVEPSGAAGEPTSEPQIVIDESAAANAVALIRDVFASEHPQLTPEVLTGEIENALGHGKHAWPLAVLRKLADALLAVESGRRRGPSFESRWLNLTGFCTRPGFGSPLDAWRVSELRKVYAAGLVFSRDVQCQVEWLVLWQRVGAGFSTGQQRELAQRVAAQLGTGQRKPSRVNPQIEREGWRLLGSLERLDVAVRTKLGDELLRRIKRDPRNAAWLWTLGRLGARSPLYGPLSSVPPPAIADRWVQGLLALKVITEEVASTIVQIAALTGDPARDLSSEARSLAVDRMRAAGHPDRAVAALATITPADATQAARLFGEPLPEGLRLEAAETKA